MYRGLWRLKYSTVLSTIRHSANRINAIFGVKPLADTRFTPGAIR